MVQGRINVGLDRFACTSFWRYLGALGYKWQKLSQFKIQVVDRYTNTVVYPGKVMIAVKAELVADSIEQVDMINSIRWCVWSQQFHRKVSPKLVFGWTLLPFSGDGLPNVEGLDLSLYPATKEIR